PALFRMVAELAAQGTAVILISHKLEDILDSCRRVVVMRQGAVVSQSAVQGKSREDLIRLLVGDDLPVLAPRAPKEGGEALIKVDALRVRRANGTLALEDVGFALHEGEVLALCGVDGNGQSELMQVLAGLVRPEAGAVKYWFQPDGRALDAFAVRQGGV